MRDVFLFLSSFLASAVEMVEALTIVLAVGLTRGWRSTMVGVGSALAALAAIVAALGPALSLVPIDTLRLIVGFLLLVFGLQWLRKAILRASGYTPLHDEDLAFRKETDLARESGPDSGEGQGLDWYAFTLAFKGVLLEGLEVAFIVVTFGSSQGNVPLAAAAAVAALLIVGGVGAAVRAPLSRVPENALKFGVGAMLSTFGIFWAAEGAGVQWPGADAAIPVVLAFVLVLSFGLVALLERAHRRDVPPILIDPPGAGA